MNSIQSGKNNDLIVSFAAADLSVMTLSKNKFTRKLTMKLSVK
jgi:hypothetical protein